MICVEENGKYKICVGNNRYLAGLELGFTKFPVILADKECPELFREMIQNYTDVELWNLTLSF